MRKLGIKIYGFKSFLIFTSGLTMSITPGKFGEALKSYLLKLTDNVRISRSAPIVLVERLTDFIALVILAVYGSFYFKYGAGAIIAIGVVLILGVFIISQRKIFYFLLDRVSKVIGEKFTEKIRVAYDSIAELVGVKILIPAILISILSWSFECVGFYIVIKSYAVDFSPGLATFIYSFSTIAGVISMLPGGLGFTEGSMTGLLVLNRIQKNVAVAMTIIIRVATLWFAVVLGLISLYLFQKFMVEFKNER